ncbi:AT-hook motif nuclear-localized protein 25-like [Prosopis cineraria]|uniref:AT-hook motif nuclear-localized protein 25-like n=1 Tax=Prosopis cineraria TaxID=364024 RepID=UPI00240F0E3E|nr:AT-hook motif nuclear-localized protein 25-like [Prosopis cineraria]
MASKSFQIGKEQSRNEPRLELKGSELGLQQSELGQDEPNFEKLEPNPNNILMDLPTISLFNNSSPATGNFISGAGEPTTGNNQILRPAKRPVGRPKGSKNKRQVVSPPLGSQSLNSTAVIGIPTGEATDNNHILRPPKRPVGRPKGSKNQAKTPTTPFKIEESQNSTTAVIEIPAGANVEQSLLQFCLRRQVSITVLTAFGQLSNIITCHQPIQTILGPFPILSLSGTVNPIPPSGSMNSPESNFPLTVLLSLPNGLTIGGIVGKVATAASKVKVVAIPTTVQNNATFETLRVDDIQANNSHVRRNYTAQQFTCAESSVQ